VLSLCHSCSRLFLILHTAPPAPPLLSLHDALPICRPAPIDDDAAAFRRRRAIALVGRTPGETAADRLAGEPGRALIVVLARAVRSEEHTSELQSLTNLVCRLLLEKKKQVAPSDALS